MRDGNIRRVFRDALRTRFGRGRCFETVYDVVGSPPNSHSMVLCIGRHRIRRSFPTREPPRNPGRTTYQEGVFVHLNTPTPTPP